MSRAFVSSSAPLPFVISGSSRILGCTLDADRTAGCHDEQ